MKLAYKIRNNSIFFGHSTNSSPFIFNGISLSESDSADLSLCDFLKTLQEEDALKLLELIAARFPNSQRYEELLNTVPQLTFNHNHELIFFGGSFNPWHDGHSSCLNFLKNKEVIVIPDRNPFKELRTISVVDFFIELSSHLKANHHINPEFIIKTEKNPTYNWVKLTKERYSNTELSLLMGMDSLESIQSWHKASELLNLLSCLYVASREEDLIIRDNLRRELSKYPNLEIQFLGHHPYEHLSSSEIRNQK